MPLLGQAAVAMWWSVGTEQRAEFADWHSHEHFPERMSIPGFRRGSRWTSAQHDGDFFVMYELERYETLSSNGYLDRLNAPTPWSIKMMPHHLGMVRSQCRVAASFGGGIAVRIATVRLSPIAGRETELRQALTKKLTETASQPGMTSAHLLVTETPPATSPTTEQAIRGSDKVADWIVLLAGYDPAIVEGVAADMFSMSGLRQMGARDGATTGLYDLSFAMAQWDVAPAA